MILLAAIGGSLLFDGIAFVLLGGHFGFANLTPSVFIGPSIIGAVTAAAIVAVFIRYRELLLERTAVAEASRVSSEQKYQSVIESMSEGFCILDANERFVEVNEACCRLIGRPAHEILGKRVRDLVSPDSKQQMSEQWERRKRGENSVFELKYDQPDGSAHWIRVNARRMTDDRGRFIGSHGFMTDITETKRYATELEEARDRYERAASGSSDAIWDWNIETGEEYLSPRWEEILGYDNPTFVQQTDYFIRMLHPDDVDIMEEHITAHLRRDVPYDVELRARHKSGNYKWIRCRGQVQRSPDGKPRYMSGSITDVTAQKEAQMALRESEERFRDFAEAGADRFWEMDAEHRFTYVSPATPGSVRFDSNEMIGKQRWELSGIDANNPEWRAHRAELDAHVVFRDFEYQRKMRDGSVIYMRTSGIPRFDEQGRFIGYRGINRDVTPEAQVKQQAADAQRRFMEAIENLKDGVVLWDADDRFVIGNTRFYSLSKERVRNLLKPGLSWSDFVRARAEAGMAEIYNVTVDEYVKRANAARSQPESVVRTPDGWTQIRRQELADGSVIEFYSDITALREAEDALKRSEERFRNFTAATADRFWETDANHRYIYFSPPTGNLKRTVDKLLGYAPWEAQGRSANGDWDWLKKTMERHEPFRDFRYTTFFSDRQDVHVRYSGVPVFDQDGNFTGYQGTTTDETAEVEARELAKTTEKRFFDAIENLQAGFFLWDPEDRLLQTNSYVKTLYPKFADHFVSGRNHREIVRATAESGDVNLNGKSIEEYVDDWMADHRKAAANQIHHMSDGRYINVRKQRLADGSTIAFHLDVTEEKRQEEELKRARDEANAANRAKSEFLANMSHELRTPLNAIIGFSEALKSNAFGAIPEEQQSEYLDLIFSSGTHLLNLINEILDLSAIEAGKLTLNERELSLADISYQACQMVRHQAEINNVSIVDKTAGTPIHVYGDEIRLKQVLVNLLSNAVKFTPSGGTVTIDAESAGNSLTVSVTDTGIGMDREEKTKALEWFGRSAMAARLNEGTGLGLPLAHQLVKEHGGRMVIKSKPGKGTRVTIWLPGERVVHPSRMAQTVH